MIVLMLWCQGAVLHELSTSFYVDRYNHKETLVKYTKKVLDQLSTSIMDCLDTCNYVDVSTQCDLLTDHIGLCIFDPQEMYRNAIAMVE